MIKREMREIRRNIRAIGLDVVMSTENKTGTSDKQSITVPCVNTEAASICNKRQQLTLKLGEETLL